MAIEAITNNPYRTLGLLAGASTREITRQSNNLKKYITAGVELPADYSFEKLDNFQRTVESIDDAIERNDTDPEKMENALFWFWKGNDITDEPAFDALKEGDIKTAYQIWDKLVIRINEENKRFWNNVTARNASAFHNRAVLVLLDNLSGSYVSAVMANIMFIESDYFSEFVKSTVDVTYKVSKKDIELNFLGEIINEIIDKKTKTSLSQLVKYLKDYDFSAKTDFLKFISQKFTTNITAQIEIARKVRTANKQKAAIAGENLYKNTKNDLVQLKEIFGVQDFSYSNTADKVANEVLQCSIDFFNDCQDENMDNDYLLQAVILAKMANKVSVSNLLKDKIQENINTLVEMENKDVNQAIDLLESVKEAYEKNKAEITALVKNKPLGPYESINWDVVNKMIRDSIKWTEVNKLLNTVLNNNIINKILNSGNKLQINQIVTLINYLTKISNNTSELRRISQLLSSKSVTSSVTPYNIKKISELDFIIRDSEVRNSELNTTPFFRKYIRYVNLNLKIEVFESQSIDFYLKYITPDGKTKRGNSSPQGYSFSAIDEEIRPSMTKVGFAGWGNADKSTYDIGTHYIEVYVDDCMIHRKEFVVDLAPSEKLEIEEKKLEKIKETTFLISDIDSAKATLTQIKNTNFGINAENAAINELNEIAKFHLFRNSSTKERQIAEQQQKIKLLKERSTEEKNRKIAEQEKVIYQLLAKSRLEKEKKIVQQQRIIAELEKRQEEEKSLAGRLFYL